MIFLLSLMACVFLVIARGLQIQRDLVTRQYSWRSAALVSVAWLVTFVPSLQSACTGWGCRWSVSVVWLANQLREVPTFGRLSQDQVTTITMLLVGLLTILFLGQLLGWLLYGTQRLLRRPASVQHGSRIRD
ncbi:hypothetical protein [Rhizobium sp. AAP43]|uniref:hypothetical protein n=1 Tax=Rhizobium sp. AAP43 TaxID=1523420 RepID=UPI0006B88A58|nr:hypothetical protein [Rhizobium sp. AAP43]KPF41812.1 hypothetical protein IP76_20000 [Rhizobium sp. AAP43]